MWIEPLVGLAFVALLIPLPRFPLLLWRVDQMNVNPVPLSVFWFCHAYALLCLYLVDHSISLFLAVTTVSLRTLGMS
jgi:hypothetical protein